MVTPNRDKAGKKKKDFDKVPRQALRWALRRQEEPKRFIEKVMALYHGNR